MKQVTTIIFWLIVILLSACGHATDRHYHNVINKGLNRFAEIYLDIDLKTEKEFAVIMKS